MRQRRPEFQPFFIIQDPDIARHVERLGGVNQNWPPVRRVPGPILNILAAVYDGPRPRLSNTNGFHFFSVSGVANSQAALLTFRYDHGYKMVDVTWAW